MIGGKQSKKYGEKTENKKMKSKYILVITNMRIQIKNAILLGLVFSFIYTVIVLLSVTLDSWIESLLQLLGLTIALLINHKLNEISRKARFLTDIIITSIFGILSNSILWILYPSSELNTTLEFVMFHLNNNYIIALGVLLSLLLALFDTIIRKKTKR